MRSAAHPKNEVSQMTRSHLRVSLPELAGRTPKSQTRPVAANRSRTITRIVLPAAIAVAVVVGVSSPALASVVAAGPVDGAATSFTAPVPHEAPTDTAAGGASAAVADPSVLAGPAGALVVSLLVWGAGAVFATRRRALAEQREAALAQ